MTATNQSPAPAPHRRTIGLMMDDVDGEYQRTIWVGVEEAAREADVDVVCFLGGDINPAIEANRYKNAVFNLISPDHLDGLIIVSTVLATYIGNENLREYCSRYSPLPMVSLGFLLSGICSVLVDSQDGIRQIICHLIDEHKRSKFVFLSGTSNNADSVERQRLFVDTLTSRNIPINPEFIISGNFHTEQGYEIISGLLDRGCDFDAV
ncbi:MAG TPA: substrate-binding domain-containing protein, partial [Spirochaetota bacterium]